MPDQYTLRELDEAGRALKEAEISLRLAVKAAYPVGIEVVARVGGRKIIVRVEGHGTPSAPGDVRGTNVATDKHRRFHYSAIIDVATPGE